MNIKQDTTDNGYLFNVDILINNESNALALHSLIEIMNKSEQIVDFRIQSGIELGGIIEALLQSKKKDIISKSQLIPPRFSKSNIGGGTKKDVMKNDSPASVPTSNHKTKKPDAQPIVDPRTWIKSCITDNRLVRLTANRQGQHLDIPCRILNFDEEQQFINVYHVDEKQVYSFNLNEIDSFTD